jgi:DNA primase
MAEKRPFLNFKAIKDRSPLLTVLDRYGVALKRVNNTQFKAKCPLPTHTSKDSDTFSVNVEKNVWYCHSDSCRQNGHRAGGNVIDFVALMDNASSYDAAAKLSDWFSVFTTPASTEPHSARTVREPSAVSLPSEEINHPLAFELKGIAYCDYLKGRGVSEETAKDFGIGLFPGKGSMAGRVVIPIRNEAGQLVAYAGRSLNGEEPKYRLPAGFHKAHVLYNLHSVGEQVDCVICVEGFFDTMSVYQAGFPNVVGLMGRTVTEEQAELLKRFPKVVLMLDGDAPGREAQDAATLALSKTHWVYSAKVPEGKQPDGLSPVEIQNLLNGALA